MYQYTTLQWILFFIIYCLCGWIWETCYVSVKEKKFVNRGFLYGPWIPIYGSGAIIILLSTIPVKEQLWLVYIFGMLGATVLELVTGMVMEKLFHVRYWDYSKCFCNFKGYICLKSSLFWGVLSVLLIKFIHNPIEKLVYKMPHSFLQILTIVLMVMFVYDFALSFREAMDLRFVLEQLAEYNAEKKRLRKKRLDVISAVAIEEVEEFKENVKETLDYKIEELRWKYEAMQDTREYKRIRNSLKRNPLKATERYKEVLQQMKDEIKEQLQEKLKK